MIFSFNREPTSFSTQARLLRVGRTVLVSRDTDGLDWSEPDQSAYLHTWEGKNAGGDLLRVSTVMPGPRTPLVRRTIGAMTFSVESATDEVAEIKVLGGKKYGPVYEGNQTAEDVAAALQGWVDETVAADPAMSERLKAIRAHWEAEGLQAAAKLANA